MKMTFSPVVLFVYNRLWHTRKTVEALKANELAKLTDLIVYSDAPANPEEFSKVQDVRDYIRTITGFKNVTVIQREQNLGLAANIVCGVTQVVNRYGSVIVLEDDIVTSSSFLIFMNQMLEYYRSNKNIWHISGWNYPIDSDGLDDVYCSRVMNCWGWATWSDRWCHFQKNPDYLDKYWSDRKKYRFDLDGSGIFWSQVTANRRREINTWAIFWYATIFERNGLCLNPSITFVDNIGHDGSGVNCAKAEGNFQVFLNTKDKFQVIDNVVESELAIRRVKKYYKSQRKPLMLRLFSRLKKLTSNCAI